MGTLNTGESVVFRCNTSFALVGQANLTCRADGTFSYPLPTCVIGKSSIRFVNYKR